MLYSFTCASALVSNLLCKFRWGVRCNLFGSQLPAPSLSLVRSLALLGHSHRQCVLYLHTRGWARARDTQEVNNTRSYSIATNCVYVRLVFVFFCGYLPLLLPLTCLLLLLWFSTVCVRSIISATKKAYTWRNECESRGSNMLHYYLKFT